MAVTLPWRAVARSSYARPGSPATELMPTSVPTARLHRVGQRARIVPGPSKFAAHQLGCGSHVRAFSACSLIRPTARLRMRKLWQYACTKADAPRRQRFEGVQADLSRRRRFVDRRGALHAAGSLAACWIAQPQAAKGRPRPAPCPRSRRGSRGPWYPPLTGPAIRGLHEPRLRRPSPPHLAESAHAVTSGFHHGARHAVRPWRVRTDRHGRA